MPRYKTRIILDLTSEEVMNERWAIQRFKQLVNAKPQGFTIEASIDPFWEEVT